MEAAFFLLLLLYLIDQLLTQCPYLVQYAADDVAWDELVGLGIGQRLTDVLDVLDQLVESAELLAGDDGTDQIDGARGQQQLALQLTTHHA